MPIAESTLDTEALNRSYRVTAHNAFEPHRAPTLANVLEHVSSIEIDFWDYEHATFGARPKAWFVRHLPIGGNVSNGSPPGDLRSCLTDVRDALSNSPSPHGAFVFLDKQQEWSVDRAPADLDALLVQLFGDSVFRPADLAANAGTPRAAIRESGWSAASSLGGRVCFVLTGGLWGPDVAGGNAVLSDYVVQRQEQSVCFVAPRIREEREITERPWGFRPLAVPWVVIFNNPVESLRLSKTIHDAGFLSRVYLARSDAQYRECVSGRANFIAVDAFEENSWNDGKMSGVFL